MKKLLLLAITSMFLLSCGGGGNWSDEDMSKAINECVEDDGMAKSDCECMVNQMSKKFESYEEMEKTFDDDDYTTDDEKMEILSWMMEMMEDCDISPEGMF